MCSSLLGLGEDLGALDKLHQLVYDVENFVSIYILINFRKLLTKTILTLKKKKKHRILILPDINIGLIGNKIWMINCM